LFTIASWKLAPVSAQIIQIQERGKGKWRARFADKGRSACINAPSLVPVKRRSVAMGASGVGFSASTTMLRSALERILQAIAGSTLLLSRWRLFGSRFLGSGCGGFRGEGLLMDAIEQLLGLSIFVPGSWILLRHDATQSPTVVSSLPSGLHLRVFTSPSHHS
jgi:hypothetical protein